MSEPELHTVAQEAAITFRIIFTGPCRVGKGEAVPGVDSPVDRECPLPATSIKGAMRAEAAEVLGIEPDVVDRVFGRRVSSSGLSRGPGGWRWSEPVFDPPPQYSLTTRVRIADERGVADESFLAFNEAMWATTATFSVTSVGDAPPPEDGLVLRASGRSISGLGSMRRRGFGQVRIVDVDGDVDREWSLQDTRALLGLIAKEDS